MPRYYFHLGDGQSLLEDTGLHLRDLAAAQDEAVRASGNLGCASRRKFKPVTLRKQRL